RLAFVWGLEANYLLHGWLEGLPSIAMADEPFVGHAGGFGKTLPMHIAEDFRVHDHACIFDSAGHAMPPRRVTEGETERAGVEMPSQRCPSLRSECDSGAVPFAIHKPEFVGWVTEQRMERFACIGSRPIFDGGVSEVDHFSLLSFSRQSALPNVGGAW